MSTSRKLSVGLLFLAAAWQPACAHRQPAMLAAPRFVPCAGQPESARVAIRTERVDLECQDAESPFCRLHAEYEIENPGSEKLVAAGWILSSRSSDLVLEAGADLPVVPLRGPAPAEQLALAAEQRAEALCQGPPAPLPAERLQALPPQCRELCQAADAPPGAFEPGPVAEADGASSAPDRQGLCQLEREICECPPLPDPIGTNCAVQPLAGWLERADLHAFGFELEMAPGARARLGLRAALEPGETESLDLSVSAAHLRHFILYGEPLFGCRARGEDRCPLSADYLPADSDSRAAGYRLRYALSWPATWKGEGGGAWPSRHPSMPVEAELAWEAKRVLDRKTGRLESRGAPPPLVTAELTPEPRRFHLGGPLLGLGASFEPGETRLLGRLGYEIAYPSYLLYALQLETDFDERLGLVPSIQAASPAIFVLPSLSVGAGLPIRLLPEPQAGLRLQLGLQWPLLGLLVSCDVYPGSSLDAEIGLAAAIAL
ncbi:MAG: hypothetical protein JXR96_21310 [Deltaproteobacteria bacterium]|nr:hypothetical protein [Deltaproteobacteria bacterium]